MTPKPKRETPQEVLGRIDPTTQGRGLCSLRNPILGYNAALGTFVSQDHAVLIADLHLLHLDPHAILGDIQCTATTPRLLALAVPVQDVAWWICDPPIVSKLQAAIDAHLNPKQAQPGTL